MEAYEPGQAFTRPVRAPARTRDRRRVARYPCVARIHANKRMGLVVDISTDGLSFQTMDHFTPSERVELCVAFEATRAPILEVVQTATVVWTRAAEDGRPERVGVKFPR